MVIRVPTESGLVRRSFPFPFMLNPKIADVVSQYIVNKAHRQTSPLIIPFFEAPHVDRGVKNVRIS